MLNSERSHVMNLASRSLKQIMQQKYEIVLLKLILLSSNEYSLLELPFCLSLELSYAHSHK